MLVWSHTFSPLSRKSGFGVPKLKGRLIIWGFNSQSLIMLWSKVNIIKPDSELCLLTQLEPVYEREVLCVSNSGRRTGKKWGPGSWAEGMQWRIHAHVLARVTIGARREKPSKDRRMCWRSPADQAVKPQLAAGMTGKSKADTGWVWITHQALFIHCSWDHLWGPNIVTPESIHSSWSIPDEVPGGPPNHDQQVTDNLKHFGKRKHSFHSPLEQIKSFWAHWLWATRCQSSGLQTRATLAASPSATGNWQTETCRATENNTEAQ